MIAAAMTLLATSACSTTSLRSNTSGWNLTKKTTKRAAKKSSTNPLLENAAEISSTSERSDVALKISKPASDRRTVSRLPPPPTVESGTTQESEIKEFLANDVRTQTLNEAPAVGVAEADKVVSKVKARSPNEAHLIFDFPVTYNSRVRKWIKYFQTTGRPSFRRWLERSSRYIPGIQDEMKRANLPLDLAYVAMIESGFSSNASSHANALGMWQFIAPTGTRYGLSIDWWIDERRDFEKSTKAAIGYMADLFEQFGSWHLVAASYNMGENGVRRLIKRYKTNSFWDLADRGALPEETRNYLPKMLAAMLIAKAPALYGFRDLEFQVPYSYDTLEVPGGTDLINLANHLGVSERSLTELNPELLKAFIPREVRTHRIRIPKGSKIAVSQFVNSTGRSLQ